MSRAKAGRKPRGVAITGGTRGIGRTVAELFLNRGDQVAVCSRSLREKALPSAIWHTSLDVRGREALQAFAAAVRRRFGSLDVFINCAGVSRWRAVGGIDEPFLEESIDTNVFGTLWGCAAAAPMLSRGGCIVNVSSLAGKRGSANNSAYCAAKFAVNGITQALAKELGPRGIRVNAVCPVYVKTREILAALAESDSPAQGRPQGSTSRGLPTRRRHSVGCRPPTRSPKWSTSLRAPTLRRSPGSA